MLTIPARVLCGLYAGFLLTCFVPWNLHNMESADELETRIRIKYGQVHSHDELGFAMTHFYAIFCILASLIQVYKCGVIICASSRQLSSIWLYPLAIFASIGLSVFSHEKFHDNMMNSLPSFALFTQSALAVFRGFLFYQIFYSKAPVGGSAKKVLSTADGKTLVSAEEATPSLTWFLVELSSKLWFVGYWVIYALVAAAFYNELVRYIAEEHIDLATIMKFVLV